MNMNSILFKKELREKYKVIRKRTYNKINTEASKIVSNYAFKIIQMFKSKIVAGYWPFNCEINCLPLIENFRSLSKTICLPVTVNENLPLEFRVWEKGAKLIKGKFGVKQPESHSKIVLPDLLIVPLLSFDGNGNRLGYGGGYYDRTIKSLREKNKNTLAIGLAFENQECSSLPSEEFDVPLDAILHNKGLVFFH